MTTKSNLMTTSSGDVCCNHWDTEKDMDFFGGLRILVFYVLRVADVCMYVYRQVCILT